MPSTHSLKRLLPIALSTVLLLLGWSSLLAPQPVAYAHAFVIGSDPIDGSTVASPPRVVRIFFDAAISPASIAHVYTPDQQLADAARSSVSPTNPRELDTPLKSPDQLPQGGYLVRWTALADADGHTTQGVIGFNIGHSSTGLPGETILGPSTSNCLPQLLGNDNANCGPSFNLLGFLSIAWQWLVSLALTFWLGILLIEGLLLQGIERSAGLFMAARRQARPLQWLCLTALLVGEILLLILRTSQFSQATTGGGLTLSVLFALLTRTSYGYLWLLRLTLVLVALLLLEWYTRFHRTLQDDRRDSHPGQRFRRMRQRIAQEVHPPDTAKAEEALAEQPPIPRRSIAVYLMLAALLLLTYALTSHAASLGRPHLSALVLTWLYLAARSAWFGSVAYMGYILLPLLPLVEADRQAEICLSLLRRLQPWLLAASGVLLVSALFLAESSLSTPTQLLSDPYGRTLLVQGLLIALLLALTGYTLFTLRRKLTRQVALLPVVHAEMPARRARQSALEQTTGHLKQSLRLQAWLGSAALLCAAILTFFAPPIVFPDINYPQSLAAPAANATAPTAQTKQLGTLSVTLQVLPARVNAANTVIVILNDATTSSAISDATLHISINMQLMNMGTARATMRGGTGVYTATFPKNTTFSMAGLWDIQLSIVRPHQQTVQTMFSVTLEQ